MNNQLTKAHLKILESRFETLRDELGATLRDDNLADERFRTLHETLEQIKSTRDEHISSVQRKYQLEIEDSKKNIKLAEEVLNKKKEERKALIDYLSSSDLLEHFLDDLRDFDWHSLEKITQSIQRRREKLFEKEKKAEILNDLNLRARERFQDLQELISSTTLAKERANQAQKQFLDNYQLWKSIKANQEKRIHRIKSDNERLNLLIRQCVAQNEPISEYITKNIHAKCQSFVHSENPEELKDGLMKFKRRQERIITLLKYKYNRLESDTNKLQVARDQTHDQLKYYNDIISERRHSYTNRQDAPLGAL